MKEKSLLKNTLYLDLNELREEYVNLLPWLTALAQQASDSNAFIQQLGIYLADERFRKNEIADTLKRLLQNNNTTVYDLSRETQVDIRTFTLLFDFLNQGKLETSTTDLFVDLFFLFLQLEQPEKAAINPKSALEVMKKWPVATVPSVQEEMAKNKERIVQLLVEKIENKPARATKYTFTSEMTAEDKLAAVHAWWNEHLFHIRMAIRHPDELNRFLGNSLPEKEMDIFHQAYEKGIPFFVTPYYLSLLCVTEGVYDDQSLRSYIIYSSELVETFGKIKAWEKEDVVVPGEPNAAGWILPEGHNIHRRYPEVAILIPNTMGRACGGLCASCQRMYDFQNKHLNFDIDKLKPKETWSQNLKRLMKFYEEDPYLKDILITGGDALMSQNHSLKHILDEVLLMAERKREANKKRSADNQYAEMKRVRFGTRLPVYLPMRIDDGLIKLLSDFRVKAKEVGIEQFVIQTHFQTPLELTPEAIEGIRRILSTGWFITNQLVYNVGASRLGHTTALRHALNKEGVLTYYTFSVKGFRENHAVFAPMARSLQERKLEKINGQLSVEQREELCRDLQQEGMSPAVVLPEMMKKYNLPFLATDRNVLNLPGIGKSATFEMIGYDTTGERVLQYDHDHTRKHSPVIAEIGKVNITENKSIAAYLRQLESMGEDIDLYNDIWQYTSGETERVFRLFQVN
jgi:lysine 2,3-aminomutase